MLSAESFASRCLLSLKSVTEASLSLSDRKDPPSSPYDPAATPTAPESPLRSWASGDSVMSVASQSLSSPGEVGPRPRAGPVLPTPPARPLAPAPAPAPTDPPRAPNCDEVDELSPYRAPPPTPPRPPSPPAGDPTAAASSAASAESMSSGPPPREPPLPPPPPPPPPPWSSASNSATDTLDPVRLPLSCCLNEDVERKPRVPPPPARPPTCASPGGSKPDDGLAAGTRTRTLGGHTAARNVASSEQQRLSPGQRRTPPSRLATAARREGAHITHQQAHAGDAGLPAHGGGRNDQAPVSNRDAGCHCAVGLRQRGSREALLLAGASTARGTRLCWRSPRPAAPCPHGAGLTCCGRAENCCERVRRVHGGASAASCLLAAPRRRAAPPPQRRSPGQVRRHCRRLGSAVADSWPRRPLPAGSAGRCRGRAASPLSRQRPAARRVARTSIGQWRLRRRGPIFAAAVRRGRAFPGARAIATRWSRHGRRKRCGVRGSCSPAAARACNFEMREASRGGRAGGPLGRLSLSHPRSRSLLPMAALARRVAVCHEPRLALAEAC